ncbi:MAG TPA: hypothetical protein PLO37_24000 [Candidatus Hydrogenedentes bacterium]|nr:hypothetical protein [Candidatus Hydrogenedentota bacterium]
MSLQEHVAITALSVVLAAVATASADAPVTVEMLTALRAQERVAAETRRTGTDREGKPYVVEADGTTQVYATLALRKTYNVPCCVEFAPSKPEVRFPFVIEPNQRLVDALDALKQKSGGFAQWRLLHGRIILSYGQPGKEGEMAVMDRPVKMELSAATWREAMLQIESAYNEQYDDMPLVVHVICPESNDEVPILGEGKGEALEIETEASLREIVLSILDKIGDPRITYTSGAVSGSSAPAHYRLTIRYPDVPEAFQSDDDAIRCRTRIAEEVERLQQYAADAQRRRDEAAKAAADAQE